MTTTDQRIAFRRRLIPILVLIGLSLVVFWNTTENGFVYDDNAIDKSESVISNLEQASDGIRENIAVYRRVAEAGFEPEVVISDFESWTSLYGEMHRFLPALAYAAVAAGADGLIIEAHPDPETAWSDGEQSLDFKEFVALMDGLRPFAAAAGREMA